jgi:hypothetical protein
MSNKPAIRRWVDALRSGEFEQTQGQLGKVGQDGVKRYCCLGVACEVAAQEGVIWLYAANLGARVLIRVSERSSWIRPWLSNSRSR